MNIEARGRYHYFLTFTDDLSRYGYIYLKKHKSETFEKFKEFQSEVEKPPRNNNDVFISDADTGTRRCYTNGLFELFKCFVFHQ